MAEQKITPFLMFTGRAEEAINFYVSLFANSKIVNIVRYGPDQQGKEGTVLHAIFEIEGQQFMAIDSSIEHAFTFTPSISFFMNCAAEPELDRLYEKLAEGGQALMPLDDYGFSRKYGWVQDRFGVSWQLNLSE